MSEQPFAVAPILGLLTATSGLAGFPLQNATPTILTWTAPTDGKVHRFALYGTVHVTSAETGGQILVSYMLPDGTPTAHTVFPAGQGTGDIPVAFAGNVLIQPGSAVVISQNSALSAGAATMWLEIWGS